MYSSVAIKTAPAIEPVGAEEVKRWCRIDDDTDDDLVSGLIVAARAMIEEFTSRALITQTLVWTMSEAPTVGFVPVASSIGWPTDSANRLIDLPRGPAQSVSSVSSIATDGTPKALVVTTDYVLDVASDPGRLQFLTLPVISSLSNLGIEYVAGYGDTADKVPQALRTAIMMLAAFFYENRGDSGGEWPKAVQYLIEPFRIKYV